MPAIPSPEDVYGDGCVLCGAPPDAPWLNFEPARLSAASPAFVAYLADSNWTLLPRDERTRVGRSANRPERVLCTHRFLSEWRAYVRVLEGRLCARPQETDPGVRAELFELVYACSRVLNDREQWYVPSKHVQAEAVYELALLRKLLLSLPRFRPSGANETPPEFGPTEQDRFDRAVDVLWNAPNPWTLVRPLIQLLRAAPVPTLTPHLRYWHDSTISPWPRVEGATTEDLALAREYEAFVERERQDVIERFDRGEVEFRYSSSASIPPKGWSNIPRTLASTIHGALRESEKGDPRLQEFRTEFSRYVLDRLKPHEDAYEKCPIWRLGYVRAIKALTVNAKGRGHRVLHAVAQHDADERVRSEAHHVYDDIRRDRAPRGSPRRAVLDAIWFLFQAHMMAHGVTIDEVGAEQTRRELIRRTTEPVGREEGHT